MTSFWEALIDTGKLLPLLAAVYFFVGFFEYRYGDRMGALMSRVGALGPLTGAAFGCIPQCGFSVVAAALYVKGLISRGTLLAVFISTSDEAVPVLLSMPQQAPVVVTLVMLKVAIAILAGMALDLLLPPRGVVAGGDSQEAVHGHPGCCAHGLAQEESRIKALVWHPLLHTLRIGAFLFVLSFLMNIVLAGIGRDRIRELFAGVGVLQPLIAILIGSIPNCFSSVVLAQFYAQHMITFGALLAGLCASAGLGVLVLLKEHRDRKDTLLIFAVLLAVSLLAGGIIQAMGV